MEVQDESYFGSFYFIKTVNNTRTSYCENKNIPISKNESNLETICIDLDDEPPKVENTETVENKELVEENDVSVAQSAISTNVFCIDLDESIEETVEKNQQIADNTQTVSQVTPCQNVLCIDLDDSIDDLNPTVEDEKLKSDKLLVNSELPPNQNVMCIDLDETSSEDEINTIDVFNNNEQTVDNITNISELKDTVDTNQSHKTCDQMTIKHNSDRTLSPTDLLEPLFVIEQPEELFLNPNNSNWGFPCKYCERIFFKKEDLRKEYMRHAQEKREERKKEMKTFICSQCGTSFVDSFIFECHQVECFAKLQAKGESHRRTTRSSMHSNKTKSCKIVNGRKHV